ncbi:MAG: DUF1800 domain-containing protein [Flavobacteriia bacterium]|nr:DUF1800 domain-containing protein [Flavobacteriia bacterium]
MFQKQAPKQEPPIDLVEQFYKENVDMKAILNSRRARKEVTAGLEPYTGEFGKAQKKHLLNRTMVGMAKRHMDDLDGLSLDQAIELIFTPEELGEPVNNYFMEMDAAAYKERYESDDVAPGEPFIDRPYKRLRPTFEEQFGSERRDAIKSWTLQNIYLQQTSIHWKLFIFFHNLFPTKSFDLGGHKFGYNYIKLIFNGVFDSFDKFIHDLTLDPSMLNYLNLRLSRKETPDENYAREVQELFTVGKRPFSKFTEEDVRGIARALVGWTFNYDKIIYDEGHEPEIIFQDWNHDSGNKQFSSFYNNKVIQGKEGDAGAEELQEVIDMIFETEESCIHPCRRLYQFFVHPVLTDDIEEHIIKPMAVIMRNNNFSIIEPLRVLLKSAHFFDDSFYNSLIKSPLEFTFSMHKEFDLFNGELRTWIQEDQKEYYYSDGERPDLFPENFINQLSRSFYFFKSDYWTINSQGMGLFEPPSVSGWPAYYQEPVYDLFWVNSVTIKQRKQTSEGATRWGVWLGSGVHIKYNIKDYLDTYITPNILDALIDEMEDRLLGAPIPAQARVRLRNSVLGDKNPDYWTQLVDNYFNNPTKDHRDQLSWRFEQLMFQFHELAEIHLF